MLNRITIQTFFMHYHLHIRVRVGECLSQSRSIHTSKSESVICNCWLLYIEVHTMTKFLNCKLFLCENIFILYQYKSKDLQREFFLYFLLFLKH